MLPYAGRHERFLNETIPNVKMRGKGTKLGGGYSKVRLSLDRMTILSFHLAYYEGKGTKLGEGERD